MKKASGFYADSLEMLLDTMCNILGGVVFITLTLAVLVRNAPSTPAVASDGQAMELTNQLAALTISNETIAAETALTLQRLQETRQRAPTNVMRLPLQTQTAKVRWPVIIAGEKLYPVQFFSSSARDNKAKNTRTIDWRIAAGGYQEATPRPQGGIEPESGLTEMVRTFQRNSRTNFYFLFLVKADSFGAFNRAKETAANLGFQYGWKPYGADQPFILSSSRAEDPSVLPQN